MAMPAKVHSQPGKPGGTRKKDGGGGIRLNLVVVIAPLIVEVPLAVGVTLVGVSVQVEAGGMPEQAAVTAALKPVTEVTVNTKFAGEPAETAAELGCAEMVKSGIPEAVPEPVRLTVCWRRVPPALVS